MAARGRRELHLLAQGRGLPIPAGPGCACAVCRESPYPAAGHRDRALGPNFTDHDLLTADADKVCVGCAALLAGRPGDEPPPLRTVNVEIVNGHIGYPDRAGLHARLCEPSGVQVLSWATSRQRHHWLRAGWCTSDRLLIGSDDGTIEYSPGRDRVLLDAVSAMLMSPTGTSPILSREAIRVGRYHPAAVQRFGLARWRDLEAIVSRWRPSLLLDLLVAVTPLSKDLDTQEGAMLDPYDDRAATLLARIASASLFRRRHGKIFWDGFYRHRVERFKHAPLADMVSRLLDAVAAPPVDPAVLLVLHDLERWSDEDRRFVAKAITDRTALVIALAYERLKGD